MKNNNVEVISLIFKSKDYLDFIASQLSSELCKSDYWDVGVRIVANDATPEILSALEDTQVPFTIFNNPDPSEYYLNRVYRAFNFCVTSSKYDNVILVNSDVGLFKGWIDNLMKYHNGTNIPCARLVESGKMPSGQYGVNLYDFHFGRHPKEFNRDKWEKWVERNSKDEIRPGGLFGPVVFNRELFIKSGGYPEGNIYKDGVGTCNGPVLQTSDNYFFYNVLEAKFNMKHITVFSCPIYHIQEGEKDA